MPAALKRALGEADRFADQTIAKVAGDRVAELLS